MGFHCVIFYDKICCDTRFHEEMRANSKRTLKPYTALNGRLAIFCMVKFSDLEIHVVTLPNSKKMLSWEVSMFLV